MCSQFSWHFCPCLPEVKPRQMGMAGLGRFSVVFSVSLIMGSPGNIMSFADEGVVICRCLWEIHWLSTVLRVGLKPAFLTMALVKSQALWVSSVPCIDRRINIYYLTPSVVSIEREHTVNIMYDGTVPGTFWELYVSRYYLLSWSFCTIWPLTTSSCLSVQFSLASALEFALPLSQASNFVFLQGWVEGLLRSPVVTSAYILTFIYRYVVFSSTVPSPPGQGYDAWLNLYSCICTLFLGPCRLTVDP